MNNKKIIDNESLSDILQIKECQIAILVVLYAKEISQSPTILSLINQSKTGFSLSIVNNGPQSIQGMRDPLIFDLGSKGVHVSFYESLNNEPLSKIYNRFINNNFGKKRFIILDDDTCLPHDYLEYCKEDCDLLLPVIKSGNKFEYPKGELKNSRKISLLSISSGMILSNKIINVFLDKYGNTFDERYALYGIDTVFFARLQSIINKGFAFNVNKGPIIEHSLSKNSASGKNQFRMIERTYDLGLTARFYPMAISYIPFIIYIGKLILTGNLTLLRALFYVLLKGKHPRC